MAPLPERSKYMLIHSMLPRSAVNGGPGERAVVWFQGCDLHCRGCFNPASHPFDRACDKRVEEVAEWVLACQGIEGLTLSGGEPFQQAGDLRHLCEYIKLRRPEFSIGVFSGYTLQERSSHAETVSNDLEQRRRDQVLPLPSSLKAIRNPWTDVAFSGRCVD